VIVIAVEQAFQHCPKALVPPICGRRTAAAGPRVSRRWGTLPPRAPPAPTVPLTTPIMRAACQTNSIDPGSGRPPSGSILRTTPTGAMMIQVPLANDATDRPAMRNLTYQGRSTGLDERQDLNARLARPAPTPPVSAPPRCGPSGRHRGSAGRMRRRTRRPHRTAPTHRARRHSCRSDPS